MLNVVKPKVYRKFAKIYRFAVSEKAVFLFQRLKLESNCYKPEPKLLFFEIKKYCTIVCFINVYANQLVELT